jgi:SHAQKYF class myb-like DNA-binding protein
MTSSQSPLSPTGCQWTADEHARYLAAINHYPGAQWKVIAAFVGTRTPRQVMTHAQKIALKQERHARGLRSAGRPRGDSLNQKRHSANKHKTESSRVKEERALDASPGLLYSTISHFVDKFDLDALETLGSPSEAHASCLGVFGERDEEADTEAVEQESLPREQRGPQH